MSARKRSKGPKIESGLVYMDDIVGDPIFASLPPAALEDLLDASEVITVPPETPLLPPIDEDMRRVSPIPCAILIEGMAKVHTDIGGLDKVLNYVDHREVFYPKAYTDDERKEMELTSMSPSVVLKLNPDTVDKLAGAHAGFKQALTSAVQVSVDRRATRFTDPRKARLSTFVIEERLLPTNRVKVLRHDLCVECDACYEACADRHGVSRLWPSEIRMGVIQIPYNCHNCHYPTCEPACRFDVLKYDEDEPELRVSHDCVGCQACARACSYGAITMVPFDAIDPGYLWNRAEDARGGRMYSVKCDNCAGFGDLACITACPTGALFQVDGAALLDLLEDLDEKGTSGRVLDKLNPPPIPFYRFLSWSFFIAVTIVASWEVIARYFWPEWTAMAALGLIQPDILRQTETIYRYRAGWADDLSMLYGYLSAGFAAGSQLYRVRKWMGSFGGDMRLWLQWHIITAMFGVMFAFWHIALNFFDSLHSIAWWAFFVVILSGIVGTYLHTFVPKGQAGKELKLEQLQQQLANLNRDIESFYSTKRGAKLALSSKPSGATKLTRLQDLKMLSNADNEFLTGVFKLVMADLASLKDRDTMQRAAFRRAGVTGEKKRQLEQLMKKRSKIERGIAFYERIRSYSRQWLSMHRAFSYIFFVALILHIAFVTLFG